MVCQPEELDLLWATFIVATRGMTTEWCLDVVDVWGANYTIDLCPKGGAKGYEGIRINPESKRHIGKKTFETPSCLKFEDLEV